MQEKRRISYTAEHIQWVIWNDCSHPPVCSLPISLLCSLNSSFPPPSFFPPSPVFLFSIFSPLLPFSTALFLSSPPFPSFPWISFSLILSSPFLPPISFLLPLYFSFLFPSYPLSSPFYIPPRIIFPLYFFLPFVASIIGFCTKKILPSPRLCKAFSQAALMQILLHSWAGKFLAWIRWCSCTGGRNPWVTGT